MQVTFWGVRGSTPTPQQEYMRYGGNTACIEVRLNGRLYIFDCGTGFRNLGKHLAKEYAGRSLEADVFVSHYHWDHIQGIPFFVPLYDSGNYFRFHSSSRTRRLREALEGQMVQPYFPVNMSEMAARREFFDIGEGQAEFQDCRIVTRWLNHPQGCLGFRVETSQRILVYATDNEPGNPALDKALRELAQGADLLICDSQYRPEEYHTNRRGWGHSHWQEAVCVARESGVKDLILFHHDPDHDDDAIDDIVRTAAAQFPATRAAAEGMVIEL